MPCARDNHQFDCANNLLKHPFNPENCVLDVLHTTLRTSDVIEKILSKTADDYSLCDKLAKMCHDSGSLLFILTHKLLTKKKESHLNGLSMIRVWGFLSGPH